MTDESQEPLEGENELEPVQPEEVEYARRSISGLVMLIASCGGALLLVGGLSTPGAGATRSSKLEWESRQSQIEAAIEEMQRSESPETTE